MNRVKKKAKIWAIPLVCGLFMMLMFKAVFMIGYVPSASMEPTIKRGSYIIGLRILGELQRGDIVIFRRDGRNLVKRIAAMPGDIICISGAVVQVNCAMDKAEKILQVPEGCFFMLGDNSSDSFDSRYWDIPFVSEDDILAKTIAR